MLRIQLDKVDISPVMKTRKIQNFALDVINCMMGYSHRHAVFSVFDGTIYTFICG